MQEPLVISFYTKDSPYEQEAMRLFASCQRFGIESEIEAVPTLGSWEKNCAHKPAFILEKLSAGRSVFWVDADAQVMRKTTFQEFAACDFSVRVEEFLPKTHESRIISNAIFARPTPAVVTLLQEWVVECEKQLHKEGRVMEFWDQAGLRDVLSRHPHLPFLPMPLKFSKIFDFDDLFISEEEVIIEHYQASRRFKAHMHASHHHLCH